MFFHSWMDLSWMDLVRVVAVGAPAYLALLVLLGISGKRTLSKLNAFDLVITVAMGSTLATILLSRDVSWSEGVVAFGLLIGLQFLITWTSVRSPAVRRVVKSEPQLLFYRSRFLADTLKSERVTAEILAAARAQGIPDLESVGAVVLETDGSLTVVAAEDGQGTSTLQGVKSPPDGVTGPRESRGVALAGG